MATSAYLSKKEKKIELGYWDVIAEIKWKQGFVCTEPKCKSSEYYLIKNNYARRCKKCGYEETPIMNTAFEDSKIPVFKKMSILFTMQNNIYQTVRGFEQAWRIPIAKLAKINSVNENSVTLFFKKVYTFIYEYDKKQILNSFIDNPKHAWLPDYSPSSDFEYTFTKGLKTEQQMQIYSCLFDLLMEKTLPRSEIYILCRLVTGEEIYNY